MPYLLYESEQKILDEAVNAVKKEYRSKGSKIAMVKNKLPDLRDSINWDLRTELAESFHLKDEPKYNYAIENAVDQLMAELLSGA